MTCFCELDGSSESIKD